MKYKFKKSHLYISIIILMMPIFVPGVIFAEIIKDNVMSLSIEDAVKIAIKNNKSIQIQEQRVASARADILYTKSLFLPQVNTGYGYTYTDSVFSTSSTGILGSSGRKDPRIYFGFKNDNSFNISAEESIYNGGANIALLNQAKLGLKVETETLRAAKLDVEYDTKRLFYGILLAYENKRIAQDLVNQAKAHYDTVKMKFDQGTTSKFDLLQSKVQVSKLIPQLVNAENAIDLLMSEFKKLLSLDMTSPVTISGHLEYTLVDIRESEFLQTAYQNKPEMILKKLGIDINKWSIEFAKSGWLPQVSANAEYIYRSNDIGRMVNTRHDNWNAGVKVGIAIFDGFSTKAKVDQAKAGYGQAILEKEDVAERIAVEIRDACLNLKEAKAIIDSQKDSVDEAKEALRLSEERYKNGVGINLDVLDAEVSLAQVEQNLAQGIYDYILANAQLDKTMGTEFLKEGSK